VEADRRISTRGGRMAKKVEEMGSVHCQVAALGERDQTAKLGQVEGSLWCCLNHPSGWELKRSMKILRL